MAKSTQIYRQYQTLVLSQTGAGNAESSFAFTATRKIRIRGWVMPSAASLSSVGVTSRGYVELEVTRSVAQGTNFLLDKDELMVVPYLDVAQAEIVGGTSSQRTKLERHLTRQEADDLGLLLDYGETIRAFSKGTVVGSGTLTVNGSCTFFYEEV